MKLWEHQLEALPRLLEGNQLLAWEAGTGKTFTALSSYEALTRGTKKRRALIICPANVRLQWEENAVKLFAFSTQLIVSTTTQVNPSAEIVIISYEAAASKIVWQSIMRLEWDAVILDEAHYVKQPAAKRTKAIFGSRKGAVNHISARAKRVWALTGTPILNDPSELWVLVSRLFPRILDACHVKNRAQWIGRWCEFIDTPYGPKITGARDIKALRDLLAPHMMRVRRKDVIKNMPPLITDVLTLPPRKIEIEIEAEAAVNEFFAAMGVAEESGDFGEVEKLEPQLAQLRRAIGLSKAKEIAEFVRSEIKDTDRKALVFFLHTDVGKEIAKELQDLNAVIFDGKIGTERREQNKKRFIEDPACQVFVGQIHAAGTGTDGLQVADRVIIAEEPFSPALLDDQVIPRAHRAGQTRAVHATSVRIKGSFDEQVARILARKRKMINPLINGE